MRDDAGWLGALLAVTLIGWALQPAEHAPPSHVPVQASTTFRDELPLDRFDFPLPESCRLNGRLTRLAGSQSSRTVGRFACPLPPRAAAAWFRDHLPGRVDVLGLDGREGYAATVSQTTATRRATVRVTPAGRGSELFVVLRDG